jgi:hypothetical protein
MQRAFLWGKLSDRDHLEDVGIDGTIILKCKRSRTEWGMNWILVVLDNDRWRALVYAVMNL